MNTTDKYIEVLTEILSLFHDIHDRQTIVPNETANIDKLTDTLFALQSAKPFNTSITTGSKIRAIRQCREKSIKELSKVCGVSEASVRFWESNNRFASDESVANIAAYLDVPLSTLRERNINSLNDCIHVLFEIEESGALNSRLFQDVLALWKVKREQLAAGELTKEEYQKWKWELRITQESERRKNDHENNAE